MLCTYIGQVDGYVLACYGKRPGGPLVFLSAAEKDARLSSPLT